MDKKVFIAHGAFYGQVVKMFRDRGWTITTQEDADFLCLTGGEDISPKLYGEIALNGTYYSEKHDEQEIKLIEAFSEKPKLGICRGGQLLNVVVGGGRMYQDVDGHHKTHPAYDTRTGDVVILSSIHHQMMIPGDDALVLLDADVSKERSQWGRMTKSNMPIGGDPECIYYPKKKALCFQPHPEVGPKSCTDYFFNTIDELFFPEV